MYLDQDSQKKPIKLESGDRCIWYIDAATIGFMRGDRRLMHEGDDKFNIAADFPVINQMMNVLAETHNLAVGIDREDTRSGLVIFRFK